MRSYPKPRVPLTAEPDAAELAALKEKADLFDMLADALGFEENETLAAISISKCDMIGTVRIQTVGLHNRQVFRYGGDSLLEAARVMSEANPYDEEL